MAQFLPLKMRTDGGQFMSDVIVETQSFENSGVATVDAVNVKAINRQPEKVFMPEHPKADDEGFIYNAAVNVEEEMVEMLEASRQYQNNIEVISTLRALMMRTIQMGK